MKKMGLPEAAIRHKMARDGIVDGEIDRLVPSVISDNSAPGSMILPPGSSSAHSDLEQYKKMQKIGMPESAIRHKMKMNGISSAEADQFISSNFATTGNGMVHDGFDHQAPASSLNTLNSFQLRALETTQSAMAGTQNSLQSMLQSKASTLNQVEMKSDEKPELTPEEIEQEMEKRRRAFDSTAREIRKEGICIIEDNELTMHEQLGEGRFAAVFRATWKGQGNHVDVAVKQFQYKDADPPIGVTRNFKSEALCANYFANHGLGRSSHDDGRDRIVQLLGVCLKPTLSLVLEFGAGGSLHEKVQLERLGR
jgi:hypothetical protein